MNLYLEKSDTMNNLIYVFGAHSRARTLKEYLTQIYPEISIQAFLFDDSEDNLSCIDGIPVIDINDSQKNKMTILNPDYPVYLGIRGVNHEKVTCHLKQLGFKTIIPVTVDLDSELRNKYLIKAFHDKGVPFKKISDYIGKSSDCRHQNCGIGVYVVSSAFDAVLNESFALRSFEKRIQVGCRLTDKRVDSSAFDDEGDSISDRNKQFCELTALYWIWKNAKENIVGLEHYRRFFIIPDNLESVMGANGIDVILPVPLFVAPNLQDNYLSRHADKPWNDMLQILAELYPEDLNPAQEYFNQGLYSPCNMLIARKEIFNAFCEWLFPILFKVADMNGELEDRYQNRYPGFLSERLMSYYFDRHKDKFNIVYADKNFLS